MDTMATFNLDLSHGYSLERYFMDISTDVKAYQDLELKITFEFGLQNGPVFF